MKKLFLSILTLLFLLPSVAGAVTFTFENHTDQLVIYTVYWIDHPYEWQYPSPICGGEVQFGGRYHVETEYYPGEYYFVIWVGDFKAEEAIKIPQEVRKVLITITDEQILFVALTLNA